MTDKGPMVKTPAKFLTVGEVAQICNCSDKQVRRWIARSELVAYRLGRLVRIAPKDLEAFLKMRRD